MTEIKVSPLTEKSLVVVTYPPANYVDCNGKPLDAFDMACDLLKEIRKPGLRTIMLPECWKIEVFEREGNFGTDVREAK